MGAAEARTEQEATGAPAPFSLMVKPVGSRCNLRCSYCYYLETDNSPENPAVMSEETLRTFLSQYLATVPAGSTVSIVWHGGEPALAGMEFYRRALSIQREVAPEVSVWNNLQTNGTFLSEEWCQFLAENRFDVGISLDGPELLHDGARRDGAGNGSFSKVTEGIRRLKDHGIAPDLLCTVSHRTARMGGEAVYRALREYDSGWMQFIPIVIRQDPLGESVGAEEYGDFLMDVFAAWFYRDLGRTQVQLFSEMALVLSGGEANLCWIAPRCGRSLIVEADGGVYACDHFVDEAHRLGSVHETDLSDLFRDPRQQAFGADKERKLTAECRACPHLAYCGGACPKDRSGVSRDGEAGQYLLCSGLRRFYDYAVPRLRFAMERSARGIRPEEIRLEAAEAERKRMRSVGRNDPCPCGSGRKAKNCCLRRVP